MAIPPLSLDDAAKSIDVIDRAINLLSSPIIKMKRVVTDAFVSQFKIGLKEFLDTSYNRCRYYKTILSRSPVNILNTYTNVKFKLGDISARRHIADDDLIANIPDKKYIVVTGSAGGGKSMFMRYLTMKVFYEMPQYVPIFLELRKLNDRVGANLLDCIRIQCSPSDHFIKAPQFNKFIKDGNFIFILDGFDELNFEIRDTVQSQLLMFQKDFPKAIVVVSSRHDERFSGWAPFHEYSVEDLDKNQCLNLISKLQIDNDSGVRDRFYTAVNSNLYSTHTTFLSSPLLITIMLFTYEGEGDVPSKMHEFYGSAYDVLFQRHDATKEQFVRKKYTKLSKEDFAICFSAFCALSYRAEKFEFDEDSINYYADRAIKYANSSEVASKFLTVQNFRKDMVESVCLLQLDGKYWAFVHRSFQEYFSAKFLARLDDADARKLLDEFDIRRRDNIVSLFFELDKDKLQRIWLLPYLDLILGSLENKKSFATKFRFFFSAMNLRAYRPRSGNVRKALMFYHLYPEFTSDETQHTAYSSVANLILKLYNRDNFIGKIPLNWPSSRLIGFDHFLKFHEQVSGGRVDELTMRINELLQPTIGPSSGVIIKVNKDTDWFFEAYGVKMYISEIINRLTDLRRDIKANMTMKASILDDIM